MKKEKNNGFTLMEMLGVIVILAIVSIIAIPLVLNMLENMERESFKSSVAGIIRTVEQNISSNLDYEISNGVYYIINNGVLKLYNETGEITEINYKGDLKNATGHVIVLPNDTIYATVTYSKWCAIKNFDSASISVYSISEQEKCHMETENPNLLLSATLVKNGTAYVSETWTDSNILLTGIITDAFDIANYKYKWYRNGREIANATEQTYIVDTDKEDAKYNFSVTTSSGFQYFSNAIDIKIDKNEPTCNIVVNGTKTKNNWYISTLKTSLKFSDSISGIKNYGISLNSNEFNNQKELEINSDGSYKIYGIVENNLGKRSNCSVDINVDTKTNIIASISGILEGTNTAYVPNTVASSNVVLTSSVKPSLNTSGYIYQWYKNNNPIEGANDTKYTATSDGKYYLQVQTASGIIANSNEIIVKLDLSRPTCTLNVTSGMKGNNGWYQSNVVVNMNSNDSVYYGMNSNGTVNYNNVAEITLNSTGRAYCYVASKSGTLTNSNYLEVKIDKINPVITSLTGISLNTSYYNTNSIKLTAVASDSGSGIDYYEFYRLATSTSSGELLGKTSSNVYTVNNPVASYGYKVKVYDKAGLVTEKKLTESCSMSKIGTCSNGSRIDTYSCTTGRTYTITNTSACPVTTTTPYSGGSSSGSSSSDDCVRVDSPCIGANGTITCCYSWSGSNCNRSAGCDYHYY